ncbi:MAG: rhodanese-like domain-containing protein [Pseudomonadota bacterium]
MNVIARRSLIFGLPALGLAAAGGTYAYFWKPELPEGTTNLSVEDAYAAMRADQIWLIDIRRPDEWERTGVAEGALLIDMRRDDFVDALAAATAPDPDRPVAIVCARGVRSRRLTAALAEAGITNLIDLPEGMLGSQAGPGWIAAGLPVVTPS